MKDDVVEQLRKELLAVVYRYSQESEITLSETDEAFKLVLAALGSPILNVAENFKTGAAELAMPTEGNRQPETANCAPSNFADWYVLHGIPLGIGRENALVIYDAAVEEYTQTLERIETAFVVLHEKWLIAGHRRDMNEAMDALSLALGRPAMCKHPHGFPCCAYKPVLNGKLEACEVCRPHVAKIREMLNPTAPEQTDNLP